jgi:thiol-disulfide isomerase/thioredoxin
MLAINQPAPDFALPDLEGVVHRLSDYRGRIVVLNFWSAECPWSEATDAEIGADSEAWGARLVHLRVAANSNEPDELLRSVIQSRPGGILLKDTQARVADLYAAQTTPHLFLVDFEGFLRYKGAVHDRTFRQRVPTRFYLREAVTALLAGNLPEIQETPPYGCTIVRL